MRHGFDGRLDRETFTRRVLIVFLGVLWIALAVTLWGSVPDALAGALPNWGG